MDSGPLTVDYTYDGLGRRIEKNVDGTITRYLYDNEDILVEFDGSNTLQAKYLHGLGVDEPISMERRGQNYFYHADGLGSITSLTNSTGQTVKTYQYDSFGNIVNQTGTITNPYTYTGREYDPETGLYYYRRRYFDSNIGRFISQDPSLTLDSVFNIPYLLPTVLNNPLEINGYVYCLNNPIKSTDPLGLWYIDINLSGGFWGGGTAGILIGSKGIHLYEGVGAVTPGVSGAIMFSPFDVKEGWNIGLQAVGGIAYQRTTELISKENNYSWEVGAGIAYPTFWGASLTGYYVHEPWQWPWNKATSKKDKCK